MSFGSKVKKALAVIAVPVILHASSFAQVAMQRYVADLPKEQAALYDYLSYGRRGSIPDALYGAGIYLGFKVFYNADYFQLRKEVEEKMLK